MVEKRMVSAKVKRKIHLRDNFTCYYCGEAPTEKDIRLDHIIPYSKGGKSDIWNVVTACKMCNARKKDKRLPNEEEVLSVVRDRNISCSLDDPDVLNAPNKKVYGASRTGKVEGITYHYPRDYEVILHVTMQYMTQIDRQIALAVLLNGNIRYAMDGDADTVRLVFDRDLLYETTGIDIEDISGSEEVSFFSLKASRRPPRYSHTIREQWGKGGWSYKSLTLMRGIKYNREEVTFEVTMCLTNTENFIDGILKVLIASQTCHPLQQEIYLT